MTGVHDSRDLKLFISRLSCFAAAEKHYFEPISRLPHGAAAGKLGCRDAVIHMRLYSPEYSSVSKVLIVNPHNKDVYGKTWTITVTMLIELNYI